MLETVKKPPLRHITYLASIFGREFLHGNTAQRQRFISRIWRRLPISRSLDQLRFKIFEKLDPQSHEQALWLWAIRGLSNETQLRGWLASKAKPRIIIYGLGSVGDLLQITPVIRELHNKLPSAEIILLHHSPLVGTVLRGNPYLASMAQANPDRLPFFKEAVRQYGIADVLVEVENVQRLVEYSPAPEHLQHQEFCTIFDQAFFTRARQALHRWKDLPPILPNEADTYSWPDERKGLHYLVALGETGNLPINTSSGLDFFPSPHDLSAPERFALPERIVTIQYGVDVDVMNWARATNQRPTKLPPLATMAQITKLTKARGYQVVQVGTANEVLIPDIDIDLRGKTSLGEAACIMKYATAHIGIEGGLTFLSAAVGARGIIMFGPSSPEFLGHRNHINLTAGTCSSCYLSASDWYIYCPRGLKEPECMNLHTSERVVEAVKQIGTNT